MNKLAIALIASAMLGIAAPAAPAHAQGVVIGVDDGYRSYGYRSWWGGPRAHVRVYRDYAYPRFRHRRHYWGGYNAYGYRSWWGGY